MRKWFYLTILFCFLGAQVVLAQGAAAEKPVAVQGLAVDSKGIPLSDGERIITFNIYDSPDGEAPIWSEQQSVAIQNGIFKANLGMVNSLQLAFDQPYWLGITIGEGQELSPRMYFTESGGDASMTRSGDRAAEVIRRNNSAAPVDSDENTGSTNKRGDSPPTIQAQTFITDVIVQGSICVGLDCTSSESFGFDTIRLKENNLRIKFQDTSNSASFPSRDWEIQANGSNNGDENRFAIVDVDGGTTPFKIRGNANGGAGVPNHSLVIRSNGDIGFGVEDPIVELHSRDGDTPTLRLEQDGSSGFQSQTFDVAANETNFFIRDVTNSSQLPFKIFPGADHNALVVAANNNIGMGIQSPATKLHAFAGSASATLRAETSAANTQATVELKNPTSTWSVGLDGNFQDAFGIVHTTSAPARIIMTTAGLTGIGRLATANTLEVEGNASKTTAGDWLANSDARLKKDIQGIDNALATINRLRPVKFRYNDTFKNLHPSTKDRFYYNFIAQEYQEIFPESVQDDGEGYLQVDTYNIRPFLVGAVQELSQRADALQAENDALRAQLNELSAGMARLESLLQTRVAVPRPAAAVGGMFESTTTNPQTVQETARETDENGRPLGSTPRID